MATVPASLVKELRELTGAGIMDAKKALVENGGDIQKSVDWLRVKGMSKAAGKSGRATGDGLIGVCTVDGAGVAVEVNTETDFVARNSAFCDLTRRIARNAIDHDDIEALMNSSLGGLSVREAVTESIAALGENMMVRRVQRLHGDSIASYVHNSVGEGLGKIGALVAFQGADNEAARKIAIHVAATSPLALSEELVPEEIIERERNILVEKAEGKPPAVVEKIVAGGLKKFLSGETLLNQSYVFDSDKTVAQVAEEAGIVVQGFVRCQVGEEFTS